MPAMRFMAAVFLAQMTSLGVHAGPPIFKCTANGSITYQSTPCRSAQPRAQPTVEQLNNERQKKQNQAAGAAAPRTVQIPTAGATRINPAAAAPQSRFTCDGRTHCSHMTSCVEAKFFLANCPNVKMDGNHDGIPCERQWCK